MAIPSRVRGRAAGSERSRRTRQRIIEAAARLFVRDGYLQTTMSAIAAEAGVAYQTLYLSFGSKVAILRAAFDVAVAGDDEPIPMLERDWIQRIDQEPDGPRAVRIFVGAVALIFAREYPLYAAITAATADPEISDELARLKAQRYQTYSAIIARLAAKPGFTRSLNHERVAQVLYTVVSDETYGLLVAEHGWSLADWTQWATRAASTELYPTRMSVRLRCIPQWPAETWPRMAHRRRNQG